jgi:hypothetical protein
MKEIDEMFNEWKEIEYQRNCEKLKKSNEWNKEIQEIDDLLTEVDDIVKKELLE